MAELKCVNNSLWKSYLIQSGWKKYTHIQIQNFSTSQFTTQFHSAVWHFCTIIFKVSKQKRKISAPFSPKWFWKQVRTIWKAFSLDVLSVHWTCKPQFTTLNFWVSFWEERVMKGYPFLTGRKCVIYMSNHFPIHDVILQNRKILLNSIIILN